MPHTSSHSHHEKEPMPTSQLKKYQTPQLRDLGKLSELTQAGGNSINTADGQGTYAPTTS
jgi:hypothetical protein